MRLFAYGTLMIPAVMQAVTGSSFAAREATLGGYARFRVRGEAFPGAIRFAGHQIEGMLYEGLDPATMRLLDRFEGTLYRRRLVRLAAEAPEDVVAVVYVIRSRALLSHARWDVDRFRRRHLRYYLRMCRAFRRAWRCNPGAGPPNGRSDPGGFAPG